jgi:hypothetical protein
VVDLLKGVQAPDTANELVRAEEAKRLGLPEDAPLKDVLYAMAKARQHQEDELKVAARKVLDWYEGAVQPGGGTLHLSEMMAEVLPVLRQAASG